MGEKLIVHNFGTGTTGFKSADDTEHGLAATAVCVLPGTELAFDNDISTSWVGKTWTEGDFRSGHKLARFRQIERDVEKTHHDALELPDGQVIKLTLLAEGQTATVLQLPAAPNTEAEAQEQKRLEVVG